MTGYGGKGREKSSGPSKQHADNGGDDDNVALASGLGSVSDSILSPPPTHILAFLPRPPPLFAPPPPSKGGGVSIVQFSVDSDLSVLSRRSISVGEEADILGRTVDPQYDRIGEDR